MSLEITQTNYEEINNTKLSATENYDKPEDDTIQSIIEKEGFINYHIEKNLIPSAGGNYLGVVYEINIKGDTRNGSKELNLFMKKTLPGENNLTIFNTTNLYNTEIFVYKELAETYNELQENFNVPPEERYKITKLYGQCNGKLLILDNLVKKGYKTYHQTEVVSLTFAELAVKNLARFHALSFALQKERPDYFESKIKSIKSAFIFKSDWDAFVDSLSKIVLANCDDEYKEMLKRNLVDGLAKKYERYVSDDATKRCLIHGDYRPNNIMTYFKNGEPTDIIPVDYQLMFYGCPVLDFFFTIFTSTDQKLRRSHLTHLKYLYYETMTSFLQYFDIDVQSVFPRDEFEQMYRDRIDFGAVTFAIHMPFILAAEDDVPDIAADASSLNFKLDEEFRTRLRGVIQDYIEWGVFK